MRDEIRDMSEHRPAVNSRNMTQPDLSQSRSPTKPHTVGTTVTHVVGHLIILSGPREVICGEEVLPVKCKTCALPLASPILLVNSAVSGFSFQSLLNKFSAVHTMFIQALPTTRDPTFSKR